MPTTGLPPLINASRSIQSRVVPEVADRSAATDPGHPGESVERRQIEFESSRDIIPNFLALLGARIAVVHELTQAHGMLQEMVYSLTGSSSGGGLGSAA